MHGQLARYVTAPRAERLPTEISGAISIARVMCILLMTYVHLHFFALPAAQDSAAFQTLRAVFVDLLGRSSVPLLSVISGFLIVRSIERQGVGPVLRKRAWILLLPMVLWNVLWITLFGPNQPASLMTLLNEVFVLQGGSAQIHLAFLRDLFVLGLMAPALIWLLTRAPWPTFGAVAVIYVLNLQSIVILRPQILFFFTIGLLMALRGGRIWQPTRRQAGVVLAMFGMVAVVQLAGVVSPSADRIASDPLFDTLLRRPAVAAFSWVGCVALARSRVGGWLRQYGDATFLFFLSHGISFYVVGAVLAKVPLFHAPLPYTLAWIVAPVLTFAATVLVRRWLLRRATLSRGVGVLEGRLASA